ncbi:hypothetical protein Tco_1271886 [Tanacetum coccineum]
MDFIIITWYVNWLSLFSVSRHESNSSILKESEKASRAEETITQQNAKVSVLYDVNEPTVGSLNLAKNADVDVGILGHISVPVRISQNPNSDFGRVHGSADARSDYPPINFVGHGAKGYTGLRVVRRSSVDGVWKVGACEDVLGGQNKDEQNAIMDASMSLFGKFLAATSDNVYSPKGTTNAGRTLSESEWNTSTPLGTFSESIQSWRSFRLAANKDIDSFPKPYMLSPLFNLFLS